MKREELEEQLTYLALRQVDLAKLLGVTPRAVNLWLTGERAVPGPVSAYLRVFASMPSGLRAMELKLLEGGDTQMRDGMFEIEYMAGAGSGSATLVLQDGLVYGIDVGDARYDGTYEFDAVHRRVLVRAKVTFPPGGQSVFGISHPYEWSIDVEAEFDPRADRGTLQVVTTLGGQVQARYRYLRALPHAA